MNYAVIMDNDGIAKALVKSSSHERCYAVYKLCELHLTKLYPQATATFSADYRFNLRMGMHPDKDFVLSRLLAFEFPLPVAKDILEGEYTVVKAR